MGALTEDLAAVLHRVNERKLPVIAKAKTNTRVHDGSHITFFDGTRVSKTSLPAEHKRFGIRIPGTDYVLDALDLHRPLMQDAISSGDFSAVKGHGLASFANYVGVLQSTLLYTPGIAFCNTHTCMQVVLERMSTQHHCTMKC